MPAAKDILRHAIRMLTHSPAQTLQVVMPAIVMVLGSVIAAMMLAPETLRKLATVSETGTLPDVGNMLLLMVLGVIALLGYALLAILWHRHVLLSGSDRAEPLRPSGGIVLHYVWRAIVVAFFQFLAAFPIMLVMGMLAAAFYSVSPTVMLTFVGVLGGIAFAWVALRISVVLPAAALGGSMRISESWGATAPISGSLWGVAGFLAVLNVALSLISSSLIPSGIGAQMFFGAVIYIVEGLIFVSVLTTLYGHLIEKRDLM